MGNAYRIKDIIDKYTITNEMKEFHVERVALWGAQGVAEDAKKIIIGTSGGGPTGGPPYTPSEAKYRCDIYYLNSMEKEYEQLTSDASLIDKDSLKNINIYVCHAESVTALQTIIPGLSSNEKLPVMSFEDTITGQQAARVRLAGLSVQNVKLVIKAVLAAAKTKGDIFYVSGAARQETERLLEPHKTDSLGGTGQLVYNSEYKDILDVLKVPLGVEVPKYRCVLVFPYDEEEQYTELINGNFKKELTKMSDEYFTIFYSKELMTNEVLKAKVLPDLTADNLPCLYFWETVNTDNHQIIELEDLDNHQIARVVRRIRTAFEEEDNLQRAANRAREKVRSLLQKRA